MTTTKCAVGKQYLKKSAKNCSGLVMKYFNFFCFKYYLPSLVLIERSIDSFRSMRANIPPLPPISPLSPLPVK